LKIAVVRSEELVAEEIGTSSIDRVQLSRFYLKTGAESSLRNIVLKCKHGGVFRTKQDDG
jgi:hypothetical protein